MRRVVFSNTSQRSVSAETRASRHACRRERSASLESASYARTLAEIVSATSRLASRTAMAASAASRAFKRNDLTAATAARASASAQSASNNASSASRAASSARSRSSANLAIWRPRVLKASPRLPKMASAARAAAVVAESHSVSRTSRSVASSCEESSRRMPSRSLAACVVAAAATISRRDASCASHSRRSRRTSLSRAKAALDRSSHVRAASNAPASAAAQCGILFFFFDFLGAFSPPFEEEEASP
mmetsp:Transcript_802/g.2720  ORF Transcript_802/g.2720 Transcript_802/m.2720 type:complete len:247 (+) Transcript_802:1016-1756(+)